MAQAAVGHDFVSSITETLAASPLGEAGVVTVQRSSGRLFVADLSDEDVDVFTAAGGYVTQIGEGLEPSGVAVDEASGDVYVASGNVVSVFKPTGEDTYELLSEWSGTNTLAGEFGELGGIAVDNSKSSSAGDVYVVDAGNDSVDVFKPKPTGSGEALEGSFVGALKGGRLEEPNAIAVDASSGKLYVADSAKGIVDIYGPSGTFEGKVTGAGSPEGSFLGREDEEGNVRAIAVEEGQLFVAEGERHVVSQFGAKAEWVGWVMGTPSGPFLEPAGVGVAPSGQVYVADAAAGELDIFDPGVLVPDVKTGATSKRGKTSVVLSGVVNGDGKTAKYHFEWGSSEAYGQSTPVVRTAGTGEETINAEPTGLQAGKAYDYRLVAENENGTNAGRNLVFETLPAVAGLSTGPVSALAPTSVTLTGSLSPNGTDAHYLFEWGTSASYGNSTPSVNAGSGNEAVAAKAELKGLAPNTSYHYRLWASNSFGATTGEDQTFTTSGAPQIQPQPPSGLTHEGATLNAKVNPGELETTYHFQYGETTSYGSETPVAKLAPTTAFNPVSATLTGLVIGTTYHYRLLAENSAGKIEERDQTFQAVPPAPIEGTSAIEVDANTATVQAEINPLGHDTAYYLQYGTSPCQPNPAACTDIPAPPGEDIGSGETPAPVTQKIESLAPSTTIHYRLIAINSLGTSEGPEHQLTTQPAEQPFALADNRAWELVSPPNKHGAPIEALTREGGLILAAENGNGLAYVADGSVTEEPQGQRAPEEQQDLATRTGEGWTTQDIVTPETRAQGLAGGGAAAPEYQFFNADLSQALVEPWGTTESSEPPLAPEARQRTMYIRDNTNGTYLPLVTEENVAPGTAFGSHIHFVNASPDLQQVIITASVALNGPTSTPGLYEWSAGTLHQVSILPNDEPYEGLAELGYSHDSTGAISADGSRVVWTAAEEEGKLGHLYLRDTTRGETIQIDAAQGVAEPPGSGTAQFQGASSNGSQIFFTDRQRLTNDSTAEPTRKHADLYECDIVEEAGKLACRLTDLSVDQVPGEPASVQGLLLGMSEDGTTTFFLAQGVLAENANGNSEYAQPGDDNLYESHFDGTTWTTTFVAILSSEDAPEWAGNGLADTAFLTARVSPNGRYFAFMSAASPTGYDNRDEVSGKPDEEVYLYDIADAGLTCVSCNPTGGRPHGVLDRVESGEGLGLLVNRRKVWAEPGHEHWLAGSLPGWTSESLTNAIFQSRYLSDEGRLFFNSPDHLVPQAKSGKESVYEYEPNGLGSCESPTGGCMSLISSGDSDSESAFLEATPDGSNVFFLTAAQLVAQDTDTAFDIYDARVCTEGDPCLTPPLPAPPGCSTADACRASEPSQPAPFEASGSVTAKGANLSEAPKPQAKIQPLGTKTSKAVPATRQQLLAKALKACRRQHKHIHRNRARCEAQARRRYGTVKQKKTRKSARHEGRR